MLYKRIQDEEFEENICPKKEFKKYSYRLDKPNKTVLLPHQNWLSNYISPDTPYNGMLVFHETGTGKTCTAVSIAEKFKSQVKVTKKKVNIISSQNVSHEFRKTIASMGIFKCTGDTYTQGENVSDDIVKKRYSNYYEFNTYQIFGNQFFEALRRIKSKTLSEIKKYIHEKYSNSVLIVDEVQNIRSNQSNYQLDDDVLTARLNAMNKKLQTEEDNDKSCHDAIEIIAHNASNVKLVFLTATPMYDTPYEIFWLVNMLSLVNREPLLNPKEIFDNNNNFISEEKKELFVKSLKGKVSYLKGGDVDTNPIKLYDPKAIRDLSFLQKSYLDKPLGNTGKLNEIRLTLSELTEEHYEKMLNVLDKNDKKKDNFHKHSLQLQNISWYSPNSQKGSVSGLDKFFTIGSIRSIPQKQGAPYRFTLKPNTENPFDNLEIYAPKIASIIDSIERMENGVAFIFSQFVNSGLIPLMLALEYRGYRQRVGENTFVTKINNPPEPTGKSFIVVTSTNDLALQHSLIQQSNSIKNRHGKKVRVILASASGSEGIDLKWIRQVHILEPQFNISSLRQIVGRAIRTNSHLGLDESDKNCTVYYHAAAYPEQKESVDIHLYRLSEKKNVIIENIAQLLKENSITCSFFKVKNNGTRSKNVIIRDSFGKTRRIGENDETETSTCKYCKEIGRAHV